MSTTESQLSSQEEVLASQIRSLGTTLELGYHEGFDTLSSFLDEAKEIEPCPELSKIFWQVWSGLMSRALDQKDQYLSIYGRDRDRADPYHLVRKKNRSRL